MKIKFKRITALFAALAIMITALPLTIIPISAAGTDGESTEYSSDGYLIVRSYRQLRLAYNGSEESKIRLGADIDCDPEEYKPNYLTRLCPPIESDKTLDLAGYTLKVKASAPMLVPLKMSAAAQIFSNPPPAHPAMIPCST